VANHRPSSPLCSHTAFFATRAAPCIWSCSSQALRLRPVTAPRACSLQRNSSLRVSRL
jgi:hypothetical protein